MTTFWTADDLGEAVTALKAGALVAFPTETVYGLGADARNDQAVARVFEVKGRPSFNPLLAHISAHEEALEIADLPPGAITLAEAFWPGALSIVAPVRESAGVSKLVTAGLPTIALRFPSHHIARMLIRAFGGPLAAPSANVSGKISPTTPKHAAALGDEIAGLINGGACKVGLESTIIGFDGETPVLLRPGGIAAEDVEEVLSRPLERRTDGAITSPGQLLSHYAPNAALRLNAAHAEPGEALLGFGDTPGAVLNLSAKRDLVEAAANLFAHLHKLDETAAKIAVAPIPTHGLGLAINDRLARAAAPRKC